MPSFGAKLKQQREQRGITLEEISHSTKIGTRMLHALEEDHFDQLPGGIFNKGFIRAYARCLDMDEEQVIADYLVAAGEAEPETQNRPVVVAPIETRMETEPGPAANLPWGVIAAVLLAIALGFAAWGLYSGGTGKLTRRDGHASSASQTTAAKPAESGSPASTARQGPTTNQASATKLSSSSTAVPAKTSAIASAPLSLRINLREDSWISITADGHESTRGTLTAPAERSVQARKEIIVKVGNAGAVDFEFNRKKIPTQGVNGEVQTIVFDTTGWRVETSSFTPAAPQPQ